MNAPFRIPMTVPHPDTYPEGADVANPAFEFRTGDVVTISGRTAEFERRINGKLQFLRLADRDVIFLTDLQVAFMSAEGSFLFVAGSVSFAKPRGPLPNRLTLSKAQDAEASLKLDYVEAVIRGCLDDEEPCPSWNMPRSRALEPIIARVAERKGEKPPHRLTVIAWLDLWMTLGQIHGKSCLVARHQKKGNRTSPVGHVGEIALERGLRRWLTPEMSKRMAYAKVVVTVKAYKRRLGRHMTPEDLDRITTPSPSTFERRCNAVDRYTRDFYRKGAGYAGRTARTYARQPLPDRPYAHVEVDHCTLDLLLVDDDTDLVLGRPDLVVFRDRASGMVIGYGLGYEAPSYASFVAGLRHAMYPKDMSQFPAVKQPWPCFGRIENLLVDNAFHFIGEDIKEAARELKINKPTFRPRSPWMKGALERFFGFLNTGLVHLLPGTTLSNVVERRERDPDQLDRAKLRVSEFRALLTFFICEVANAHVSRGLGLLRGLGDIPLRVWEQQSREARSGPLPPPDLFIALCGEWEMRTIQNDGITWDHITYECVELATLINHPKHRNARENGAGTLYKCVRDPADLGRIYVENPYDKAGTILVVPACPAHEGYARGRHRHNHDLAVAEARRTVKGAFDFDALMEAMDRLGEAAARARGKPERQRMRRGLARFIDNERTARLASKVTPGPRSGIADTTAAHLDPLAVARGQSRALAVTPGNRVEEPPAPLPERPASPEPPARVVEDDEDDLMDLLLEKQWSSDDE